MSRMALGAALAPGEVTVRGDVGKSGGGEEVADLRPLEVAVLDHEPAARHEVRRGIAHDFAQRPESVGPRVERGVGLEATHAALDARVAFRDVRRVADDEGEALVVHRFEPRSRAEFDTMQVQPRSIAPRDGDRVRRYV